MREMMRVTGIAEVVDTYDTKMDIFPLDDDLLSLEWYHSFR